MKSCYCYCCCSTTMMIHCCWICFDADGHVSFFVGPDEIDPSFVLFAYLETIQKKTTTMMTNRKMSHYPTKILLHAVWAELS